MLNLYKPTGAQGHNGRQGPKPTTPEEGTPHLGQGLDPAPGSRCENHLNESSRAPLSITFWTKGCCLGVQHIMECRGKAVWDCTGLIIGCLGEEPKV